MSTPQSTAAVSDAPRLTWRAVLLWVVFVATLVTGLVLAVRFGGTVPTLLDGSPR
jgi:hypothetical protein